MLKVGGRLRSGSPLRGLALVCQGLCETGISVLVFKRPIGHLDAYYLELIVLPHPLDTPQPVVGKGLVLLYYIIVFLMLHSLQFDVRLQTYKGMEFQCNARVQVV